MTPIFEAECNLNQYSWNLAKPWVPMPTYLFLLLKTLKYFGLFNTIFKPSESGEMSSTEQVPAKMMRLPGVTSPRHGDAPLLRSDCLRFRASYLTITFITSMVLLDLSFFKYFWTFRGWRSFGVTIDTGVIQALCHLPQTAIDLISLLEGKLVSVSVQVCIIW